MQNGCTFANTRKQSSPYTHTHMYCKLLHLQCDMYEGVCVWVCLRASSCTSGMVTPLSLSWATPYNRTVCFVVVCVCDCCLLGVRITA